MKVSVCMITYNHEKYIKQAIEGVLMQECNFDVELIIADDCSLDNTYKIIVDMQQKHANGSWIQYTKHTVNKGMMPNFIWALDQCQSKYIAICEGDDYWTDPLKLQKQVDFLEANQDFVICGHNAKIIDADGIVIQEKKIPELNINTEYSSIDLKKGAFFLTLTLVFRNVIQNFPKEFYKVKNGDTFLISLLGNYGKGMYIEDIDLAMYRVHGGGVWSKLNQKEKWLNSFNSYNIIKDYYEKKGDLAIVKELGLKLKMINNNLFKNLDSETEFKSYFVIVVNYIHYNKVLKSYSKSKVVLKISLKYFYRKLFK